jgi:integrase
MASVVNDPGGRRRILFVGPDGKRRAIRLGKCDRRSAEGVARHVEHLLSAKITGGAIPRETASWLTGIGESLRDKLAAVGLIDAPQRLTLGEFLEAYVFTRPDVTGRTRDFWRLSARNMTAYFGEDVLLHRITPGDAEGFVRWMRTQKLAPTTQARRIRHAREFLTLARKHRLIETNPFAEVKVPTADPSDRQSFVSRDTFERLLAVAPPVWRTILALARLGGLRTPSETLSLEWRHIDWDKGRITVVSPKTERYSGKASRTIPLFPELRKCLEEGFELAEPGQTYVVGGTAGDKLRRRRGGLREGLLPLIHKAGLEPWPRLFHNLRASRETELLNDYPLHVVARWMGHGVTIATRHYAMTTDQHYEKAAQGGASSGALAARDAAQQMPATDGTQLPDEAQPLAGQATNESRRIKTPDSEQAITASFQDWTEAAAKAGKCPLPVDFPTTKAIVNAGLLDAYRLVYPDEVKHRGDTWTSMPPKDKAERHDRIDYVFVSKGVVVKQFQIIGEERGLADVVVERYPSDHRAVVAEVVLPPPPIR